ncbi:hypothetical protein [Salinibacterium sp. PAMC 21357]|uniref:hypothetical protein n=1 Tax=Salinibacterium sp. PAMC 21357 TaxID=1112215 RepID=UPI0002F2DA2E|nr:hypothetical protein [Salinibacterium sp. PAMC 21357]
MGNGRVLVIFAPMLTDLGQRNHHDTIATIAAHSLLATASTNAASTVLGRIDA